MAKFTILHNPKCSKSRNALKLLEENKHNIEIIEYLDNPLNQKDLKDLLSKGDFAAIDLIRTKEAKEFDVEYKDASDTDLIKAIAKFPKILQRPIVIKGTKATIARDEDWLERL